jgi:predicted Zn-dependent protease
LRKLATQWKQKLNLTDPKVNRDAYLKRIEGLIYGEDPKAGFVENNVFYHPVLKFQFNTPAGWHTRIVRNKCKLRLKMVRRL